MFKKNISSLHLPHNKNTAECVPVKIDAPEKVILPMDMHSGGLAEPVVSVGDYVRVGQLIAKEAGRFSSPVHATVSGKVIAIEPMLNAGTADIYMLDDDWTIVTDDEANSAHFEHTVVVTADGYKILTGTGE